MERVQDISGADSLFRIGGPRFLSQAGDTGIRQIAPADALAHWDDWVKQAWTALAALHDAGIVHGGIDVGSLRIQDGSALRLHVPNPNPTVATTFDVHTLNTPPEQHMRNGRAANIPFSTLYVALMNENWPIDRIRTVFPELPYTRSELFKVYEAVDAMPMDGAAADVWMLGNAMLDAYMELLAWPYVLSSEFYRTKHEQWMDVLEHVLAADPRQRWTARQVLDAFAVEQAEQVEQSEPIAEHITAETPTAEHADESVAKQSVAKQVAKQSEQPEQSVETVAKQTEPKRYRRLTLNVPPRSAGRNKTRKNSRN
jgi:hypothetical protein